MLKFNEEMLMPTINVEVYMKIYELENWLRRICLTAYVIEHGENWIEKIPNKVHKRLENQVETNSKLSYLGHENDNNFVWSATLGQLKQMIEDELVTRQLEELTCIDKEVFINKVNELREVRNLLAHNRALSDSSNIIIQGIIESLRSAVDSFKTNILYSNMEILDFNPHGEIVEFFVSKMEGNDWSQFQAFISGNDKLYNLVCLPAGVFNKYPSGAKIINAYKEYWDDILSVLINMQGDEYSILISKKANVERVKRIIDIFVQNCDIWTDIELDKQNPKYICNPKFWMYENNRKIDE